MIHRVPRGESIVSPPSTCPKCGHQVRNRHNIPVLGWLILHGRCADCGEPISARYPIVELGTGVLFAVVALRVSTSSTSEGAGTAGGWVLLAAYLFFAAISVALAGIDLDVRRLPDVIVLPSYPVLGALLALDGHPHALVRAVIGAAGLFAFYFVIAFAAPGAMGFGDVKVAGLIGAMTAYLSWGTLLAGAFGGFLFGALTGVLLMAAKRAGRKSALPFGPFMLLGAWAAILGAGHLGDAYLSLLG